MAYDGDYHRHRACTCVCRQCILVVSEQCGLLREVLPHHDVDNRWGSWKWGEKDVLILDFSHGDELHSPDDKVYEPLVITGFVAGENVLRVHRLTSSHMELSMGNRTYTLKKQ